MSEKINLIKLRKNFYRDAYYRATHVLVAAVFVLILLAAALIYSYLTLPVPDFYASSIRGDLVRLAPLKVSDYVNLGTVDISAVPAVIKDPFYMLRGSHITSDMCCAALKSILPVLSSGMSIATGLAHEIAL